MGHTKCNKDITGERVRVLEDKREQKEKGFVEKKKKWRKLNKSKRKGVSE